MRRKLLPAFLPLAFVLGSALLSVSCRTVSSEEEARLAREVGMKVPLWVEVECSKSGRLKSPKDYSVLMMPDEQVQWVLTSSFDNQCRIYGAIVKKTVRNADLCDIRFRSRDALPVESKCACVPGRYVLEEGYPTSERCCKLYPDRVYCKQPDAILPVEPIEQPIVTPEEEEETSP